LSWRPARLADLPLALLWTLGAALALAWVPLLPLVARLLPPCPLHALTGVPCVACGTTRAALALAHGHAWEAVTLNPLATVAMMGGLLGGLVAPGWVALRAPLPGSPVGSSIPWRTAAWLVLIGQWIYLVASGR